MLLLLLLAVPVTSHAEAPSTAAAAAGRQPLEPVLQTQLANLLAGQVRALQGPAKQSHTFLHMAPHSLLLLRHRS
jgi:hypothetical protein